MIPIKNTIILQKPTPNTKIYDLPKKEFKRAILRKLIELQNNQNNNLMKSRKQDTCTQIQNFNKEIEITEKNQTEILELKDKMKEVKKKKKRKRKEAIEIINSRLEKEKEGICKIEQDFEIIQLKKNKRRIKKTEEIYVVQRILLIETICQLSESQKENRGKWR